MKEIAVVDFATLVTALGCGLIGGFFFAFSAVVMKSLGKLPPAQGIAAMQSINVVVINPWSLIAFFGTAAVCVFTMIAALTRWHEPDTSYLLAGSVLYLVGTILVRMVFNVPRNNALAAVHAGSEQGCQPVGRLPRRLDRQLRVLRADSGPCRPLIPEHAGPPFRSMPA